MQAKTFVGKITVRTGEYENDVTVLLVANSEKAGWDVLEGTAQNYYGDENTPEEDGGYYANGGEIFTQAKSLEEIGLSTFLDLKSFFMVRRQANVTPPDETALEAPLAELAQSLTSALNRKNKVVSHSQVLNAIAAAYGHNNWHVLKNKLEGLNTANAPDKDTPAPTFNHSPARGLGPAHDDWIAQECERVGAHRVRFIEAQGYRIFENGSGNGWYALLPGVTEFVETEFSHNHVGYYSTLDDLVAEMLESLEYIPDEVALALCWIHHLTEPVLSSGWFSPEANGRFATAGEAARAALAARGVRHCTPLDYETSDFEERRKYIAELVYEYEAFDSQVEAVNGWEDSGEDMLQRAVFLKSPGNEPSRKVTFRVTFKRNSAEFESRSVVA